MDELAKGIGYHVLAALYLAAMLGSFVAFWIMVGWCWRAANWLIYNSAVEPFPLPWFALGVVSGTALYLHRRYEDQHDDDDELA